MEPPIVGCYKLQFTPNGVPHWFKQVDRLRLVLRTQPRSFRISSLTFRIVSSASAELVHQAQDAFTDLKHLLPRLRNHSLRQKLLRRDGFQSGLRLVQMIQRAFQVRDGKRSVSKTLPTGNAIQRSCQLCARCLKFENELTQIVVS